MRLFYDLTVWEEIDENDSDALKSKFTEFGKRLNGFGILSFSMRAGQQALTEEQQQQLQRIQQQQIQQAYQQQQQAAFQQQEKQQKRPVQQRPKQEEEEVVEE